VARLIPSSKGNGVIHGDVLVNTYTPYIRKPKLIFTYAVFGTAFQLRDFIVPYLGDMHFAGVVVLDNLVKKQS
jgi:hypothetical protein